MKWLILSMSWRSHEKVKPKLEDTEGREIFPGDMEVGKGPIWLSSLL